MKNSSLFSAFLLVFTSACGGNLNETTTPSSSNSNNPTESVIGPSNDSALVGESVGLVLMGENDKTDILWQQTSGPEVEFLGANRKVIGFDVPETGSYNFSVSYTDLTGASHSENYSFTATNDSPVYVNARLDHEANSLSKMTINSFEDLPGVLTSVNWTQLTGPGVSIETTDELSIFFTAPNVSSDSLLQFEVTVVDHLGNQGSDIVNILIEQETVDPNSHFNAGRFEAHSLADVHPYNADSPYADQLQECIYSNTTSTFCDLGKLPFLGTQNSSPSVDEIMDRLLVSHDWMGVRFKNFLEQVDLSNDIKNLLGATTSIVISYDIKPSFFWSGTGAIYIDGRYFWVTPEERDTLDTTPDFRTDFAQDLQFQAPWRVVKDNNYAYTTPAVRSRSKRTTQDSQMFVLRVLYHELAHANDFFPPRAWSLASDSDFPWSFSEANQPDSTGLSQTFPLISQPMYDLGDVMFQGNTATQAQISYTPAQVSNFFFPYGATNAYNYSTEREDYAMLAEEYLMGYRYGVLYDQGVTGLAPNYIISTAERGRVGHAHIKPRAEYVISNILPSINTETASAAIPSPITLTSGVSWWDALVAPGQFNAVNKNNKSNIKQAILLSGDIHPSAKLKR